MGVGSSKSGKDKQKAADKKASATASAPAETKQDSEIKAPPIASSSLTSNSNVPTSHAIGANEEKIKDVLDDLLPDLKHIVLDYIAPDRQTEYKLSLMLSRSDFEPNTLYVKSAKDEKGNLELKYKISALYEYKEQKERQTIGEEKTYALNKELTMTRAELIQTIGERRTNALFTALTDAEAKNEIQRLQPFQDDIFKITSARDHTHVDDLEAQNKAVQVSARAHTLFEPRLVNKLLEYVTTGQQEKAKKMLETNPSLLLSKGQVTDYPGKLGADGKTVEGTRTFNHISAFQYALWASDRHMWEMILPFFDKIERPDAARDQFLELEEKGTLINGQPGSSHFDFTRTKQAYKTYDKKFDKWNWDQRDKHWVREIGGAQREWPVHVAEEMCFPGRPFDPTPDFKDSHLPRGAKFYDSVSWFPLLLHSGLGFDFACYRYNLPAVLRVRSRRGGRGALDSAALSRLCEVRTQELADLKQRLLNPAPVKSPQSLPRRG